MTTVDEMLKDRGETNVERVENVEAAMREGSRIVWSPKVDVYLQVEDKVGVKFARAVVDRQRRAIIVSLDGPTAFARKELDGRFVEFFSARDLVCNVTHHVLVPKHERVDGPPEGVERADLPRLFAHDPVAQYYGWPVGTVVRVWRTWGGHEPIPYFRVVVSAASS